MAKGTKLSEYEKSKITALKRVGKSQGEISEALGRSKSIFCNYMKIPNKYGTKKKKKKNDGQARKIVISIQKKNCSRSKKANFVNIEKIFKSLVDAPCNTRTIRRHLNYEKIKHKEKYLHPPHTHTLTQRKNVSNIQVKSGVKLAKLNTF